MITPAIRALGNRIGRVSPLLMIAAATLYPNVAHARRGERNGFNFGLTTRAASFNTGRSGSAIETAGSHEKGEEQSVKPYVGYAFSDAFNFGLTATAESSAKTTVYPSESGGETEVTQNNQLRGGAVFGRLLFGQVFYLESSVGLYSSSASFLTQKVDNGDDGAFSGTRQQSSLSGVGTGYSFGGGFELPMSYGFYFTGNYSVATYRFREVKGSSALGATIANQDSKAVAFGIAYYGN